MLEKTLLEGLKSQLSAYRQEESARYKTAAYRIIKDLKNIRTTDEFYNLLDKKYYPDRSFNLFRRLENDSFFSHINAFKSELQQRKECQTRSAKILSEINTKNRPEQQALLSLFNHILQDPYLPFMNDSVDFLKTFENIRILNYLLDVISFFPIQIATAPITDWHNICKKLHENYINYIRHHPRHRIHSNETQIQQLLNLSLEIYSRLQREKNLYVEIKSSSRCILC